MPNVVFVLGGPGAGKGTQCAKIVEVCLLPYLTRQFLSMLLYFLSRTFNLFICQLVICYVRNVTLLALLIEISLKVRNWQEQIFDWWLPQKQGQSWRLAKENGKQDKCEICFVLWLLTRSRTTCSIVQHYSLSLLSPCLIRHAWTVAFNAVPPEVGDQMTTRKLWRSAFRVTSRTRCPSLTTTKLSV